MARLSELTKQRIVNMRKRGLSFNSIREKLKEEDDVECSRQSISHCWKNYNATGSTEYRHGGGPVHKLQDAHIALIDSKMKENNELNAKELQDLLVKEFGVNVSTSTVLRYRRKLGWKWAPTKYCQMISEKNKVNRLAFARECLQNQEKFDDVIFTDETRIQMSCNTARQCYKVGEPITSRLRPKPKHPYQVLRS